ncbi:MAG: extracellular solute-binding protein [Patescibacteria group bacterium]
MKNMTTFQIVLTGIFAGAVLVALVVFATFKGSSSKGLMAITLWGTLPAGDFAQVVSTVNQVLPQRLAINYVEKKEKDFDRELTEALASGVGPDAVLLPHTSLFRQQGRILPIPEASLPLRTFRDTFSDQARLYEMSGGVWALPFVSDPLVMYWNKDIFNTAGLANPPKHWDEFLTLAPQLTKKDAAGNITQSAVPFGEVVNISNAKDTLSALLLQAGTPITKIDQNGAFSSTLSDRPKGVSDIPAVSVVAFYTQFSNPSKTTFTWNRAIGDAQNFFLAGNLATYFAFASENETLLRKNPNLNFDITALPQPRDVKVPMVYGKLYGLALMKAGKDPVGAFQVLSILADQTFVSTFAQQTGFAPSRRDLLATAPADPALAVSYRSSLIARSWIDPEPVATGAIFKRMIESVTSGKYRPSEAVSAASQELQALLR